MAGISPWQLLIVLLIVLLIFGTKKLRNVGGDLGTAIRDFRKGVSGSDADEREDETRHGENDGDKPAEPAASKSTMAEPARDQSSGAESEDSKS